MGNERVVLITGTSSGVGLELARHFVDQGCEVIGCSRSEVPDTPGYRHFALDVRNDKDVKAMFASIRRESGRLDVLINNAGAFSQGFAMVASANASSEVIETNLLGTILCSREAAKLMQKRAFGRIVNISTVAVPLATVGNAIYSASKAGSEQFARVFAREVSSFGVTVNVLGLSIVEDSGMAKQLSEESMADTLKQTVLGRTIRMDEVTNALDFLVSEESGAVTGQVLYLGGV
jgi:3-oxoacyl-[acyl-carrier protein] reductase